MKQELWRRAEELFHAALERSPQARQTFLDEACGEDTELRRQVGMLVPKDSMPEVSWESRHLRMSRPRQAHAVRWWAANSGLVVSMEISR